MATEILTAEVAIVSVGQNIQVEGLRLSDGRFAIAVVQVCKLFGFDTNQSSRALKVLLGKSFGFVKAKPKNRSTIISNKSEARNSGHKGLINVILLEDFRKLMLVLFKRDNSTAQVLVEALFGLSLEQLFSDAFGINLTPADRQNTL
jgi:hypothetical protein